MLLGNPAEITNWREWEDVQRNIGPMAYWTNGRMAFYQMQTTNQQPEAIVPKTADLKLSLHWWDRFPGPQAITFNAFLQAMN